MNIFSAISAVFWVVFIIYWFVSALGSKRSINSGSAWAYNVGFRVVIIFIVIAILHVPSARHSLKNIQEVSLNPILGAIGILLMVFGFGWAVWARIYLGRNWGMPMTLKKDPELVTSGPYTLIRHPIYFGFLVAMLGTVLADTVLWIIPFLIFGVYFIYSAKVEDKIMQKIFSDKYLAYKKRTKMMIPFVF